MNKENMIGIVLVSIVALYAMFHVGRWYEYKQAQEAVYEAFEHSSDTEYAIVGGIYEGETASGRCFTPEGEQLFDAYYPSL